MKRTLITLAMILGVLGVIEAQDTDCITLSDHHTTLCRATVNGATTYTEFFNGSDSASQTTISGEEYDRLINRDIHDMGEQTARLQKNNHDFGLALQAGQAKWDLMRLGKKQCRVAGHVWAGGCKMSPSELEAEAQAYQTQTWCEHEGFIWRDGCHTGNAGGTK